MPIFKDKDTNSQLTSMGALNFNIKPTITDKPHSSKSKSKSLRWKSPASIKERLSISAHTSQNPIRNEKTEKQQRLMRIWRVVSHAIDPACA